MASKSKITPSNVMLIALVGIISASIFFTASPTQFTGAATATVVAMPFPVDAWGYEGWGDCSTQDKGKTWANNYCIAKSYVSVDSCYHEPKGDRWKWSGTAAYPKKGVATGPGTAFTKVKCATAKTVSASAGGNSVRSLTVIFDKEYTHVDKITIEGIPGGELCVGRINAAVFRADGVVQNNNLNTGVVDAHRTAKSTFNTPGFSVKKVIGFVKGDGNVLTPDCASLDYLKVTLTYRV